MIQAAGAEGWDGRAGAVCGRKRRGRYLRRWTRLGNGKGLSFILPWARPIRCNTANKAQVPIGEVEGGLVGGFYAQDSHRIIDMDECLIQHEANDAAVRTVKTIARKHGIPAYQEETHRGLLRHVVVKFSFVTR